VYQGRKKARLVVPEHTGRQKKKDDLHTEEVEKHYYSVGRKLQESQ